MTIGMPDSARIRRHTSIPSMPGSIRSNSTMSGRLSRKSAMAEDPLAQCTTSRPSLRRTMPNISDSARSSSTTSTRPFTPASFRPDIVLLDLMLPGIDGIEVCRRIRAESGIPIVMLTARTDTIDVVVGLESGADDYVLKPFKAQELIARVRARLRRGDEPEPEQLQIGDLFIDVAGHTVKRQDETLSLTPLEFDLLVALARKPRQVFTREVLLEQVWGY